MDSAFCQQLLQTFEYAFFFFNKNVGTRDEIVHLCLSFPCSTREKIGISEIVSLFV